MKPYPLIIILFIVIISCANQNYSYNSNLISAIKKVEKGDSLSTELIVMTIPKTEKEYLLFYSYTDPDKKETLNKDAYYKLIDLYYKKSSQGNEEVYKYLLELSMFVDGEFAESYFEDLDFIVSTNKILFCKVYSISEKTKVLRIKDVYKEYCN